MERSRSPHWNVPYLPIDPKDVGRSYESIIRINSQSGKGGVAYILEKDWGIRIPKEMQRDFANVVQSRTEKTGKELPSVDIRDCFEEEYLEGTGPYVLSPCVIHTGDGGKGDTTVSTVIRNDQTETRIEAKGNGPVDAFVNGIREGFGISLDVVMYEEHARSKRGWCRCHCLYRDQGRLWSHLFRCRCGCQYQPSLPQGRNIRLEPGDMLGERKVRTEAKNSDLS